MIDHSAAMLVQRGTPYPGPAMIAAAHNPNIFDPYLPALTRSAYPGSCSGSSAATDPRIWFGAGFVVAFAAALTVAGARDVVRWTALVTASPLIAFSLAVGGTDMPVLACLCLGFALLWRRRPGAGRARARRGRGHEGDRLAGPGGGGGPARGQGRPPGGGEHGRDRAGR